MKPKTKEQIITDMCMTYDHRYFLPTRESALADGLSADDLTVHTYMTAADKRFVHRLMTQLFENDIEPFMVFKSEQ